MATVYILYSSPLDKFYTGSCKNLKERLTQHLNKTFKLGFTLKAVDWEVFIHWDNLEYSNARKMEEHIKKMKSAIYIRNMKNYPEMALKLKNKFNTGSCR